MTKNCNGLLLVALQLCFITVFAQDKEKKFDSEFELEVEASYRYFYDDAQFPDQKDHFPSLAIYPEYQLSWNQGDDQINFKGFARVDVDDERTHWDVRELYYQKAKGNWELSIGLKKIYWGVTESAHLVDIINQTDQVESFDGEKKLGQAMVQFSLQTNFGTFDLFYMPWFRKRTFAGKRGRLRFGTVINADDLGFESAAQEWRQDLAFRWKHYFDIVDIGLSHFYGTGREPIFTGNPDGSFNAFYPVINQSGLDLQVTHDAFLWKAEAIYRTSELQDFFAFAGGLEYTISNIKNSGIDLGLLAEYLYDERDELALSGLQNDLFFGSRLAFNDTQDTSILIGGLTDIDKSSTVFSLEGSRRLGSNYRIEVEARIFSKIDEREFILSNFKQDSFLNFKLSRFF